MSDFAVGVYTTLTVFLVLAVTLGGILYIELRHKLDGLFEIVDGILKNLQDDEAK